MWGRQTCGQNKQNQNSSTDVCFVTFLWHYQFQSHISVIYSLYYPKCVISKQGLILAVDFNSVGVLDLLCFNMTSSGNNRTSWEAVFVEESCISNALELQVVVNVIFYDCVFSNQHREVIHVFLYFQSWDTGNDGCILGALFVCNSKGSC